MLLWGLNYNSELFACVLFLGSTCTPTCLSSMALLMKALNFFSFPDASFCTNYCRIFLSMFILGVDTYLRELALQYLGSLLSMALTSPERFCPTSLITLKFANSNLRISRKVNYFNWSPKYFHYFYFLELYQYMSVFERIFNHVFIIFHGLGKTSYTKYGKCVRNSNQEKCLLIPVFLKKHLSNNRSVNILK